MELANPESVWYELFSLLFVAYALLTLILRPLSLYIECGGLGSVLYICISRSKSVLLLWAVSHLSTHRAYTRSFLCCCVFIFIYTGYIKCLFLICSIVLYIYIYINIYIYSIYTVYKYNIKCLLLFHWVCLFQAVQNFWNIIFAPFLQEAHPC